MKKLIALMIVAFATLLLHTAQAEMDWTAQQQAAQRQALAEWVEQNAQVSLTPEQATHIVDRALWFAQLQDLEPALVLAVMRVESGFRAAAHGRGSKGLMQVQTYWHRDKLRGRSPYDPAVSIEVGTQILGDCWKKTTGNLVRTLRCYNGGGDRHYAAKVRQQKFALDHFTQEVVYEQVMARASALETASPQPSE